MSVLRMRRTSQDFEMDQVAVLLSEATRLLQAGRPEQAVVPLREALFRLANHLDNLGHSNRAIEVFRAAAAVASRTTLGRLAMARALLAEDRDAEALKVLRRALVEDPDSPAVLDLLANTLADA